MQCIRRGRLARRLHRGKQEGDEDADDRDHDQEFDQSEGGTPSRRWGPHGLLLGARGFGGAHPTRQVWRIADSLTNILQSS